MKFPSQSAHRIYIRLKNGGDYTANVFELEKLMKCLWKAKLHDTVAMVAEKMCDSQFKELDVARFEKYLRMPLWRKLCITHGLDPEAVSRASKQARGARGRGQAVRH
jgi:hypothetical protein